MSINVVIAGLLIESRIDHKNCQA